MAENKTKRLFIAMPFRNTYDPVLKLIKDAAAVLGIETVQIGEEPFVGSIIGQIRTQIEASDLMVAIVTEENGNVYYEIGLAHCQRKPVLLLTSDPNSLKFDLKDHRALVYDPAKPEGIRDDLIRTLKAAIEITSDPHAFLAAAFQGSALPGEAADDAGFRKAIDMITAAAGLQKPVKLKAANVDPKTRELTMEVEDFFKVRVGAVIDVNGILLRLKTYD